MSLSGDELKYIYKKNCCTQSQRHCSLTEIRYISYTCDQLLQKYKNSSCCDSSCDIDFKPCDDCELRNVQAPSLPPTCPDNICKMHTTPKCVSQDPFMAQRDVAFRCLEKIASKTHDFGIRHVLKEDGSSRWDEYNPTSYCIDDYNFLVAEPVNSLANFEFEKIVCEYPSNDDSFYPNYIKAAFLLGYASFTMHASGNHNLTSNIDNLSMYVYMYNTIDSFRKAFGQSPIFNILGIDYNISYIAEYALTEFFDMHKDCEIPGSECVDDACPFYRRAYDLRYGSLFPRTDALGPFEMGIAIWFYNLGSAILNIPFENVDVTLRNLIATQFLSNTDSNNRSIALTVDDIPNLSHLIYNVSDVSASFSTQMFLGISTFSDALSFWYERAQHHKWHELTAKASRQFAAALKML